MAEEITNIVAFLIFVEACPKKNLILFFLSLSIFLLSDLSLPCILKPKPFMTNAKPLIPIPPIPTKCIISDLAKLIFILKLYF